MLLSLLIPVQSSAATWESTADPKWVNALWIAENNGVLKMATGDGSILFEVSEIGNVRAVCVHRKLGEVWALVNQTLLSFDFLGNHLRSVEIPTGASSTIHAAIEVDQESGNLWVGIGSLLYLFDSSGIHLASFEIDETIRALAVEEDRSWLWVGTQRSVHALNPSGAEMLVIDLGQGSQLADLDFDASMSKLWIALSKAVQVYSSAGALIADYQITGIELVSADQAGGAWLATKKDLLRVNSDGAVLLSVEPFQGNGVLVGLQVNPIDLSSWCSTQTAVAHVNVSGQMIYEVFLAGDTHIRDISLYVDSSAPLIEFTYPESGSCIDSLSPSFELHYTDVGSGVDPESLLFFADSAPIEVVCVADDATASCTVDVALTEGPVSLSAQISDYAGNRSELALVGLVLDVTDPIVTVSSPLDGSSTNQSEQILIGELSESAALSLNGVPVLVDETDFEHLVPLAEGTNQLYLLARDCAHNSGDLTINIMLDTIPPSSVDPSLVQVGAPTNGVVTVTGIPGAAEPGTTVTVSVASSSASSSVAGNGSFLVTVTAGTGEELAITLTDAAGNNSETVTITVGGGGNELPPDPADVAPPLDPTVASDFVDATRFLYSGPSPIQRGVEPDAIDEKRAAVVRGRVLNHQGDPLAGVRITVHDAPEIGWTLTREDGVFDLAVNGGGTVTVTYKHSELLTAQRQVDTGWRDYFWLPDTVMIPRDSTVTSIDLTAPQMQLARGPVVTDGDGSRQATMLFRPGTAASIQFQDGTTQPLSQLSIRATEYSVGPLGTKAMPAPLPPHVAYTYCVDLSADELAGHEHASLVFSQPIVYYVENFLNFYAGGLVPVGTYDTQQAAWAPSKDGRVVRVLSHELGKAILDVTGDGQPATSEALESLGVTTDELVKLAELYTPGASLLRVEIPHFSAWDFNWPFGFPENAAAPQPRVVVTQEHAERTSTECGSIIDIHNQAVSEIIPVTGTDYSLVYKSNRQNARSRNIASVVLTGDQLPEGVKQVALKWHIAGQTGELSFSPQPNLIHNIVWDGRDGYGRDMVGSATVQATVGFTYDGVYVDPAQRPGSDYDSTFGHFTYYGAPATGNRTREEVTLWADATVSGPGSVSTLGSISDSKRGLGGWSLDAHHVYDPVRRALYFGDGRIRTAVNINRSVTTFAGEKGCDAQFGCCGYYFAYPGYYHGPWLDYYQTIDPNPDGTIWGQGTNWIDRVKTDGSYSRICVRSSIWTPCPMGSSGFTLWAWQKSLGRSLNDDLLISLDYQIYQFPLAQIGHREQWRHIGGNGETTFTGDGALATEAGMAPRVPVESPDGSTYFIDSDRYIRKVDPSGILTTVAGNGELGSVGETIRALDSPINMGWGTDIQLGPRGEIYFSEMYRIRRVRTDGMVESLVGNGERSSNNMLNGLGSQAAEAQLGSPYPAFTVDGNGILYFEDLLDGRDQIFMVQSDGVVRKYLGGAPPPFIDGAGGPNVFLDDIKGFAWSGGEEKLYISAKANNSCRILTMSAPFPGFGDESLLVPSKDGSVIFVFDSTGRHLRTIDAVTSATIYEFEYSAGYLTRITDSFGNSTEIERSGSRPTAIVGPYGDRTILSVNAQGLLESITSPANESVELHYHESGLLASLTDPRGNTSEFQYDEHSSLVLDKDAAGGTKQLSARETQDGVEITFSTSEGRQTKYLREEKKIDGELVVTTSSTETGCGCQGAQTTSYSYGLSESTFQDGTRVSTKAEPDPRFGQQSTYVASKKVSLPSGLEMNLGTVREIEFADPDDVFSAQTITDRRHVNGRESSSTWNVPSQTVTTSTPEGRSRAARLDDIGRIVREEVPGLAPIDYHYDLQGRLVSVDQGDRTWELAYDGNGRLSSITDPLNRSSQLAYDDAGRVVLQTLPDGRQVSFSRDANGNIAAITPPGRPAHSFSYTAVNLTERYTAPATGPGDSSINYTYDLDKRPDVVTLPGGETLDFDFESSGRLASITFGRGQLKYTYNETSGRLSSVTAPDGEEISYTWDGFLEVGTTWSGTVAGSVSRTFNNDLQVTSTSVNGEHMVAMAYDQDGLLTQAAELTLTRNTDNGKVEATVLDTVTDSSSYNEYGELASYSASTAAGAVYSIDYSRDALGRITSKTEVVNGVSSKYDYSYTLGGRLESVTKNDALVTVYGYDDNGNRISKTGQLGTEIGTYDAQDRMVRYGECTYTYSSDGRLEGKSCGQESTVYDYDALGNLIRVYTHNGLEIEYVIDGQNRRIGKKINGVLVQGFLYGNQLNPIAELDGNGNVIARFVYGSKDTIPDYVIRGGRKLRIISDHLDSPRLIIDSATGEIVQELLFDEWGARIASTTDELIPFGFSGGIWDTHTHLLRMGSRDYDPKSGRWTTKDPIGFFGLSTGLYSYVEGDPINFMDPYGFMRLPANPDGLPPEWKLDPNHRDPNGKRFRNPRGDVLDFHEGRPGEKGFKGKDHWHHRPDGKGGKEHLKPGDEIPDDADTDTSEYCGQDSSVLGSLPYYGAVVLGGVIIVATIVEDVMTLGVGVLDDPATIGLGLALIGGGTVALSERRGPGA
jgi:RHS repeat-associated protein